MQVSLAQILAKQKYYPEAEEEVITMLVAVVEVTTQLEDKVETDTITRSISFQSWILP